jgi:hypothetical protein
VTLLEILLSFDRAQAIEDLVCRVEQAVAFGPDAFEVGPFWSGRILSALMRLLGDLSFVFHVNGPFA